MARLYLRTVIVTVLPPVGQPKRISGLRVRFRSNKNEESKPNTMELEIFNLSESTRTALEGKKTSIILEAGYEETPEVIFTGNITKVVHQKEGPDIISRIELADGGNKYRNARISKSIPPGAKITQAIDELVKAMDLTKGPMIGVPKGQYANGVTLQGLAKDRLDEICRSNGLRWSIQDGAIQIIPEKRTTLDSVVTVSPDTGMIGSPNKTKNGIEFKTLLQPVLKPGKRVKIESRFIKGIFKVSTVNHSGDSHEGEFVTECEAFRGFL